MKNDTAKWPKTITKIICLMKIRDLTILEGSEAYATPKFSMTFYKSLIDVRRMHTFYNLVSPNFHRILRKFTYKEAPSHRMLCKFTYKYTPKPYDPT